MDIRKLFWRLLPEKTYSVNEAARHLGVHRCTIYKYIKHTSRPLKFQCNSENGRMQFLGVDLLAFKAAGLPKRGRKRKGEKLQLHGIRLATPDAAPRS